MKLPGLKARVSLGLAGFAGLPTLRSGRHSSPGLKAWGFLAVFINSNKPNWKQILFGHLKLGFGAYLEFACRQAGNL
jgi:hypothetical protein